MSLRHYRALRSLHRDLQNQIDLEQRSPQPDSLKIAQLKRHKLAIRDRMRLIVERGAPIARMPARDLEASVTLER
jgi:hypothetical protein